MHTGHRGQSHNWKCVTDHTPVICLLGRKVRYVRTQQLTLFLSHRDTYYRAICWLEVPTLICSSLHNPHAAYAAAAVRPLHKANQGLTRSLWLSMHSQAGLLCCICKCPTSKHLLSLLQDLVAIRCFNGCNCTCILSSTCHDPDLPCRSRSSRSRAGSSSLAAQSQLQQRQHPAVRLQLHHQSQSPGNLLPWDPRWWKATSHSKGQRTKKTSGRVISLMVRNVCGMWHLGARLVGREGAWLWLGRTVWNQSAQQHAPSSRASSCFGTHQHQLPFYRLV